MVASSKKQVADAIGKKQVTSRRMQDVRSAKCKVQSKKKKVRSKTQEARKQQSNKATKQQSNKAKKQESKREKNKVKQHIAILFQVGK